MNVPLTPLRFLNYAERQYPDRIAVVSRGQRYTYAQFADRVGRLAGGLRALGVEPGDRVAFLGTNSHRLLEAYYGVLEAGAVLLPLNIRLSPPELTYVLNAAGATVLFIDPQFVPLVDKFRAELETVRVLCLLEGEPQAEWLAADNYEAMLAAATPLRADIMTIDEDAVAEIFYTSGTSARPKGVMLTHRNIYLHALDTCVGLGVENGAVELHTIPLFHANGWGIAHFLTLLGGKHVMLDQFDPVEVFRLIETERVQHSNVVPIMATLLVNCPQRKDFDLSSLKRLTIGGAASSPTLVREVREVIGCDCFSGYGLTETAPVLTFSRMKMGLGWEGEALYAGQSMAGHATPGTELHLEGPAGQWLPEDGVAVGELIARADGVMKGYWKQPEATAEAMRGGWFHTGDMATLDPDGYVQIVDRKKDIIVSGGENISSLEVEKAILAHPAVFEVAVIPVSDATWGEVGKALIVLKPGASATEAEIIALCRTRLAHYKCPKTVLFLDTLPKTGTGKVLKKDLRKLYE